MGDVGGKTPPVLDDEVSGILRDHCALLRGRQVEHLGIRQAPTEPAPRDRVDVMPSGCELSGDLGVVLLVEEQLQRRESSCCRREAASILSYSSSLALIHASISSA